MLAGPVHILVKSGFFFYPDTRNNPPYISSVRPHVLKKHFAARPELKDEALF
jgi:hypothetical protein